MFSTVSLSFITCTAEMLRQKLKKKHLLHRKNKLDLKKKKSILTEKAKWTCIAHQNVL